MSTVVTTHRVGKKEERLAYPFYLLHRVGKASREVVEAIFIFMLNISTHVPSARQFASIVSNLSATPQGRNFSAAFIIQVRKSELSMSK